MQRAEGFYPVSVTGLVLAGGQGSRMGGQDKGLVELAGRPMIEFVLEALRPQVDRVLISANRHLEHYAMYGHPVVPDESAGYQGPLAGLASALRHLETEFLLTVPCDAPLLDPGFARRMLDTYVAADADIVVASDGQRLQPVFMLLRGNVAERLHSYLGRGGRRVDEWFAQLRLAQADLSDVPECFANVNEPSDCERVEARLVSRIRAR
jgi:molybdopterin-guanine dinucleotide biosynthesis protein A